MPLNECEMPPNLQLSGTIYLSIITSSGQLCHFDVFLVYRILIFARCMVINQKMRYRWSNLTNTVIICKSLASYNEVTDKNNHPLPLIRAPFFNLMCRILFFRLWGYHCILTKEFFLLLLKVDKKEQKDKNSFSTTS